MKEDLARIEARANSLVKAHAEHLRELIGLRIKHDLTQEMVAERMGVSQPTVAALEHYDSNPSLSTIRRYALAVEAKLNIEVVDDCAEHHAGTFQEIIEPISAEMTFKRGGADNSLWVRRPGRPKWNTSSKSRRSLERQ